MFEAKAFITSEMVTGLTSHFDDGLFLRLQGFLHILFEATKHHGLEDFLQFLHLLIRLTLSELLQESSYKKSEPLTFCDSIRKPIV